MRAAVALAATALAPALLSACGGSSSDEGSAQYRDRTESPLLDFGKEAAAAELDTAGEAVEAFLEDRAAGDYAATCKLVAQTMLDKIEKLAENSTGLEDTSCPAFLAAFLRLTPEERRDSTEIDPGSLRVEGSEAYLLYSGAADAVFAMPLRQEGGQWKVAMLTPKELG